MNIPRERIERKRMEKRSSEGKVGRSFGKPIDETTPIPAFALPARRSRIVEEISLFKPGRRPLERHPRGVSPAAERATKRKIPPRAFPSSRTPSFEYIISFLSFVFPSLNSEHRPRVPSGMYAAHVCVRLFIRSFSNYLRIALFVFANS